MELSNNIVSCTKKCFNPIIKKVEVDSKEVNGPLNLSWDKDGKRGKDYPKKLNSISSWVVEHPPQLQKVQGERQ